MLMMLMVLVALEILLLRCGIVDVVGTPCIGNIASTFGVEVLGIDRRGDTGRPIDVVDLMLLLVMHP